MMQVAPKHIVTVVLLLSFLGCDSKNASKSNFKAALQDWWDKNPPCVSMYPTLPTDFDLSNKYEVAQRANMEGLKSAGLLTSETVVKAPKDPYSAAFGVQQQPRNFITYSLGGSNKSAWHITPTGSQELCFAKVSVKSVDNFTEPSEMLGSKVSQVAYTYEFTDFPNWAKDPAVQKAFPLIKSRFDKPTEEKTDVLMLTNNGWSKSLK